MGDQIGLVALDRSHFPLLQRWLATPHVARWWADPYTPEAIENEYGPRVDGEEPIDTYIALLDGRPIGMIQWYWYRNEPEYTSELNDALAGRNIEIPDDAVSIDYLIGDPTATGRGLGSQIIHAIVEQRWNETTAGDVIVPVHIDNRASWRALENAGFVVVADIELEPDNPNDDRRHRLLRRRRPRKLDV